MPEVNKASMQTDTKVHHPHALTPLIDPVISAFINKFPDTLTALVEQHGSPLNVVWPHAFELNTQALLAVLKQHSVAHAIFYGAKANKSQCLLSAAATSAIGVDVSSLYELQAALRAGTPAAKICATGPAKTAAFHQALISAGALICVDSLEEFDHLKELLEAQPLPIKARVLLRYRAKSCAKSRFGMDAQDLLDSLQRLATDTASLVFEGFHFHLGGYGFESRVQAFREVSGFVEAAREMGLNPQMIDIGGGLPIRYVDPQDYTRFLQNDNIPSHYYHQKVPADYYPYGGDLTAAQWLTLFLEAEHSAGLSIAGYLNQQNITLALEPGRSLVDQAAISIFRITRTKKLADSKTVIFVEGSSFSACETWFASEYLVDPILISTEQQTSTPCQAYIAGHSCLDDDVITYRLINFACEPRRGDLLIYINTAGYQMDLLENEFHRHPLPRRLMATCCTEGKYAFTPDY
ncbi:Y4yA family PLP-dependent enzyme [Pseudomonas hamedanensis]|uniref:Y4yA family PLP-dependent enzyme n=1 Tax=Pseudomonas hamedanensis TaxID=2745504 RepID=A0A9E6THK6_9PSED|nr:Y4yA family PLP-dependent enzyme [Pseudomonas hamedanensis]QXI18515.1 Y4yA family PLP-dependent enzyme [Pseudomonas hamedanensis]